MSTSEKIDLSHEQTAAVDLCCDTAEIIASVTGGAGTGKTTILKRVYAELRESGKSVVLCAPTGRASKRIMEATGLPAMTIHRLLKFPRPDDEPVKVKGASQTQEYGPRHTKWNPLPYDVILVDESSMIGPTLYRQLLDALKKGAIVRFFGDANQLPPVEEGGAPFREILGKKPAQWLSFNFRSEDEIISNSLRLLSGSIPVRNSRFELIYSEDPFRTCLQFVDKTFTGSNYQIITPARKGKWGTVAMNPRLQLKFNPNAPSLQLQRLNEDEDDITVREKDKFIWIKNDYNFEMFNGEIGVIDHVNSEEGELILGMEDREPLLIPPNAKGNGPYGPYRYDPRKQIEVGYAVTTHKSQGSEFDTIVYYMVGHQPFLLNRNNFYTAITRAKRQVVVICDRKAMGISVRKKV